MKALFDHALPLLSAEEMRAVDLLAQSQFNLSAQVLIERASLDAWNVVEKRGLEGPVVVVAGRGNNGADALALARHAAEAGRTVMVAAIPAREGTEALRQWNTLLAMAALNPRLLLRAIGGDSDVEAFVAEFALLDAGVLVEGVSGLGQVGGQGGLGAELLRRIEAVRSGKLYKVALDLPQGIHDDHGFEADLTISFAFPKRDAYNLAVRPRLGDVEIVGSGFPSALRKANSRALVVDHAAALDDLLPVHAAYVHKYQRAAVAIFAGSRTYPGAAVLSARGAFAAAASYVRITSDADLWKLGLDPSCVLAGYDVAVAPDLGRFASVLLGPGWTPPELQKGEEILAKLRPGQALVLDAGALSLAGHRSLADRETTSILCPHSGEAARLLAISVEELEKHSLDSAVEIARRFRAVCIMKGPVTAIADPTGRLLVVDAPDTGRAMAGSGDVFAGTVCALAASLAPFEAALAGVLLHAEAGVHLAGTRPFGQASDLAESVGEVYARSRSPNIRRSHWSP